MSKRIKGRWRRRKLTHNPIVTTAYTPPPIGDMPTLLPFYVDADGSPHLMLLHKNFNPVRLLRLLRANRAIYTAGTPLPLRTRLLEQALRQELSNPNTYDRFLQSVTYHAGLGEKPLLRLCMTPHGFKTLAEWFSMSTDSLMDVKIEDLHRYDSKLKTDFTPELIHALKMFGYL